MDFLKFDAAKCTLCGKCIDKCPFGALSIEAKGIAVGDACRMCGMCVRSCPEGAIRFEQRANTVDKSKWRDFLVYVEQERGDIHPVAFELIGEARKMARKVGYKVNCVLVGGEGTAENAKKLLPYGVDRSISMSIRALRAFVRTAARMRSRTALRQQSQVRCSSAQQRSAARSRRVCPPGSIPV